MHLRKKRESAAVVDRVTPRVGFTFVDRVEVEFLPDFSQQLPIAREQPRREDPIG